MWYLILCVTLCVLCDPLWLKLIRTYHKGLKGFHKGTQMFSCNYRTRNKDIFTINLMIRFFVVISFLSLSFDVEAQNASPDSWPSFRGDPGLTGNSSARITPPLKLLWTFKTGDAIKSSPVIVNGTIYIGSNDGFLYAISSTGKLKWKFNAKTSLEAAPLFLDNTIIIGSLEGVIFAVDAEKGTLKWSYKTEGQISGSSNWTYSQDRRQKRILTGSYDYFLHCVDAPTGKPIWKFETTNFINGTPAITGNMSVFGGCDGVLHLVNTENGKESGTVEIGDYIPASAAISNDKAYFGNYEGDFYCADLKLKKILWKTGGGGPFLSSPAVFGEKVISGSQNNYLYCFNTRTLLSIDGVFSHAVMLHGPLVSRRMRSLKPFAF